ncbi:MAG: hypothetical protein QM736_05100 [Vicinamibacterales bacterium]
MSFTIRATALVAVLASTGCSTVTAIRENTKAIAGSTASITTNTTAIQQSTAGTTQLVPALQGVTRLEQPMTSLARLDQPMRDVAALSDPMARVAALDPIHQVGGGVERTDVAARNTRAAARCGVEAEWTDDARRRDAREPRVGRLAARLARSGVGTRADAEVGGRLRGPMEQLSALRAPLEQVGSLAGPMGQLAGLTALLERPVLLIVIALAALAAWGAVTFVAVRMAIISARRADAGVRS